MRTLSSTSTAWPCSSNAITTTAAPYQRHKLGAAQELGFAVLEADRVDDRLALQRLQARFDDRPLAAVDHHRHGGDVVLAGDQPQELRHHRFAVEQGLVHVDVDDVRAAFDLLTGDLDGLFVLLVLDQPGELLRAGDVRPLADHQEVAVGPQRERPRAAEPHVRCGDVARLCGLMPRDARRPSRAMWSGVVPQQPPTMFTQPLLGEFAHHARPSPRGRGRTAPFRSAGRRWDGN